MKIVINVCYGGFGLSENSRKEYCSLKGLNDVYDWEIPRDDPILVDIVEHMGEESWGNFSELKVVEIPDDVNWYIEEYDGAEHIAERHRTWS